MTSRFVRAFGLAIGLGLAGLGAGCGGPAATGPGPVAPDNNQPRMQAALQALGGAQTELTAASPNKGGHREKGLELIGQAQQEVQAGIDYASQHANEVGDAEGPAGALPVDEEVPGAQTQPHMRNAVLQLREARKQLWDAKHDKGGHRAKAIEMINQAMQQVHDGIMFSDKHE